MPGLILSSYFSKVQYFEVFATINKPAPHALKMKKKSAIIIVCCEYFHNYLPTRLKINAF